MNSDGFRLAQHPLYVLSDQLWQVHKAKQNLFFTFFSTELEMERNSHWTVSKNNEKGEAYNKFPMMAYIFPSFMVGELNMLIIAACSLDSYPISGQ